MPKDEILPLDFGWRVLVKTINAIPVSIQFFVRKPHDTGCKKVSIDLRARSQRLRSIVDELVIARDAKIEDAINVRAENRRGLETTLDQELAHRFINLMHTASHDSRCDEARRILLETLEPYLDAAEMLELA